jgi:hypothetical protein
LILLVVLTGPWPAKLADALLHGTPDDVAWVGREAGTDEVAAALADPVGTRAATIAATAVDDGWSLLDELAHAAAGWSRAEAVDATRAAAAITRTLDGNAAIVGEIPDDLLAEAAARWLAIAAGTDRWPDVRVTALEIAARIARARTATAEAAPGLGFDLDAMLADADPLIRRTAAELVPQPAPPHVHAALARAVVGDLEPAVAVAAAQALCAELAGGDPAEPILAALGPAGIERLRAAFTAAARTGVPVATPASGGSGHALAGPGAGTALPPGAAVDAARCLVADGSGPSRAAVSALASRAPRAVRAAIAKIRP